MPIVVTLDAVLASRKLRSRDVASAIALSETNFSLLKNGHVRGVRFSTLEALCQTLQCQPGDLLCFVPESGASEEGL